KNESLKEGEYCFALTYYNIGRVHDKLDDKQNAVKYLRKSIDLFLESSLSEKSDSAIVYSELGRIYSSLKDYDKSLQYLKEALDINNKSPYLTKKSLIARNYYDIGVVLYEKNTEDEKALEAFQNAITIYGKISPIDREMLAKLHDNMAMIYCREKKWIRACQAYTKSCEYRFGDKC
ncbi:unnamed protein product, partial [Rotaria sp. Silwood2]